jgi:hypothetical protein
MRSIVETINDNILNEAREVEYRVQFIGMMDTVKILVPNVLSREFENFLSNEQDNVFAHAAGGSIEY